MFNKILIANRGEIAVRIARGCREMGISPVAVYSEADRASLHVRMADEAICLGPAPSAESYLSIEKVIDAAKSVGAEAIHPGYGFLSENADFAEAVEKSGLTLIGPPSAAMRLMGSKTSARLIAQKANAPVVPGTTSALGSVEEAHRTASEIGYPIMLKAASGGGGKGLRLIRSAAELPEAYGLARSEAESSFKDSSVYIEKYIERPRHIEIQLMGDCFGNLIYLGERECSLQRRHQKVIEEAPSPIMDPGLRQRMGEAAVSIAREAGYWNAGTIEFLVDRDKNFYFLEMNTRLQVEHPVTELVIGRDLVHEQVRVASGAKLSLAQTDVSIRGHAVECRIYAEDPANNFLPSPGLITGLRVPAGPGIRNDSGIYDGWEVPVHYDSLLAKLIVWAEDRGAALARLARALDEYSIDGIHTSLGFFKEIVANRDFQAGNFDTGFIERFLSSSAHRPDPKRDAKTSGDVGLRDMAALAAVLSSRSQAGSQAGAPCRESRSRWKWYPGS
jgi:acetyl-CoA carboxylase biotin carboxylase subunit